MEDLQKMLKSSEEAMLNASKSMEEQAINIESLPDGAEKLILKQALLKAKAGDVAGVKTLIEKMQNASTG